MSALQFQEELRRVARFDRPHMGENPLGALVQKIKDNPSFAQSRLLGRILTAFAYGRGEFRRAEASALDSATLGIVIAVMNANSSGTTTRDECVNAVKAADAACVDGAA
jgi:hypothetical protein